MRFAQVGGNIPFWGAIGHPGNEEMAQPPPNAKLAQSPRSVQGLRSPRPTLSNFGAFVPRCWVIRARFLPMVAETWIPPPSGVGRWLRRLASEGPAEAEVRVSQLSASQLVAHGLEGSLRWRIAYEPFWSEFFQRLEDVMEEVDLPEALKLARVFATLRRVHRGCVDACVAKVRDADAEVLLGVKEADLAFAAEALAVMRETEALDVVLRVLASRVHRIATPLAARLVDVSREAHASECSDFADALLPSFNCIPNLLQPGAQSAHLTPCRACVVPLHPRLGYSLPQSAPKDIAKRKANASELPLAILIIRITDITEAVGRQLIVLHQEPRPTGTACTAPAQLFF
eukprot:s446_g4.t1